MMAATERLILPLATLVVAVGALVMATGFTEQARQVPMFVGVPLAVLAGGILVREISRTARGHKDNSDPPEPPDRAGPADTGLSQRAVLGILAGLALCWLLLGFPLGAVLFLVLFLRFVARAGWLATVLITALTVVPLHIVFAELLNVSSYGGMLLR